MRVEGNAHLEQLSLRGLLTGEDLPLSQRPNMREKSAGYTAGFSVGIKHLVKKPPGS